MSRVSIVLENDEGLPVGTGANGRLFNDQLNWPGTSDPAPISQCPPSATQDDGTFMELPGEYAHYPPPTEGPASLPVPRHSEETLVTFPSALDLQQPPLHQPEGIELGRLYSSPTLPRIPSAAETDVMRDTSCVIAPLSDDHPFVPTRLVPSPGSYFGESSDHEWFTATMGIRGSTCDCGTMTTPLGTTTTFSPSSSQALGLHSHSYLTLDDHSSLDPCSTHDEAAPSLGHHVCQLANTVGFTPPSSRAPARRNPKKYRCIIPGCSSRFAQRQGLNRHIKDKHSQLNSCLYCGDFEWSKGRSYKFTKHLRKMHPGVLLP
ncbi:hypothetical protein H4582DRAFT_147503 [Lactarius indigo]|nr:hypothetical protein H4582DRAFT_147503 [Lactarius indigo]